MIFMVAIRKILDVLEISKKDQLTSEHKTVILENQISSLEIILSTSQKSQFDYTQSHFNNLCLTTQEAQIIQKRLLR